MDRDHGSTQPIFDRSCRGVDVCYLRVVVAIGADEADLAVPGGEAEAFLAGLAEDPVCRLPGVHRQT